MRCAPAVGTVAVRGSAPDTPTYFLGAPRAARSASLAVLLLLSLASRASAAPPEASDYSPLPPPADPLAKTVLRPLGPRVAPPPPPPAPPPPAVAPAPVATTTTSSAVLPGGVTSPEGAAEPPPRARPALDDEHLSVAPLLGFATDNLDLGVGVRAGAAALAPHVWVGGTFVYHLGTSTSGAINGVPYSSSSSAFYVGPEIGYDLELGPVVLRPYGGVGLAALSARATSGAVTVGDTVTKLVLWPGATVLYGLPSSRVFVGGDARFLTIPGGPAVGLFALAGMTM
jgi:hypothetical protein